MQILDDIKAATSSMGVIAQADVKALIDKAHVSVVVRQVACAAAGFLVGGLVGKYLW